MVGVLCQHRVEAGQRLVDPALILECDAEVVVRFGKVRIKLDGPAVAGLGFREAPQRAQGVAQVGVGAGVIGRLGERPSIGGDGGLEFTLGAQRDTQIVAALPVSGLEPEHAGVALDGLVETARPVGLCCGLEFLFGTLAIGAWRGRHRRQSCPGPRAQSGSSR